MIVRSVLCTTDLSEASQPALRAAARAASQFGATLHVLAVDDLASAADVSGEGGGAPPADRVARFIRETPHLHLPATPSTIAAAGDPAREILTAAAGGRFDVIVMGTCSVSEGQPPVLGATAARVLEGSTVPVLLVPSGGSADKARNLEGLGRVLVPLDYSLRSDAAADTAARLAQQLGAPLLLLHVIPGVTPSRGLRPEPGIDPATAEAHYRMGRAMARLEKYGPVESTIVRGDVGGSIVQVARARNAGLIVLGLAADAPPRPESTVYAVASTAPIPVLAVPVPAPARVAAVGAAPVRGRRPR